MFSAILEKVLSLKIEKVKYKNIKGKIHSYYRMIYLVCVCNAAQGASVVLHLNASRTSCH